MADANEGRKPVIAANWKMHHDHLVAIQTVQKLSYRLDPEDYDACEVVVCPPFTDLRTLQTADRQRQLDIRLGAQNCYWEDTGAFTGEVSPVFLAKLNVQYVIVGHSERRQLFGETDEAGEQEGEGRAEARDGPDRLRRRDARGARGRCAPPTRWPGRLAPRSSASRRRRPRSVWSRTSRSGRSAPGGTRRPTTRTTPSRWCGAALAELYDSAVAAAIRIQYGGSVKPGNAAELMAQPEVDGALVGGASLDPDDFARIVQYGRA